MTELRRATVIGAGSWGTALGSLLAAKGLEVALYARRGQAAIAINTDHRNPDYLSQVRLPDKLRATSSMEEALSGAPGIVVLSVPSRAVRGVVRSIRHLLTGDSILINTAKGLEGGNLPLLSAVIAEEAGDILDGRLAVLSGPSHAEEVIGLQPTAVVVASGNRAVGELIQGIFFTPFFRVYTNSDVIGVEVGGALKNVIALATGMAEGLGYGDNTRAALMTRGLAEITRMGLAWGANPLTFTGLAGVGDLIATCTSQHSRNRKAGIQLGCGMPLADVLAGMGMIVEGVATTEAAYQIAGRIGVEMPITGQVYRVLFEGERPENGVQNLMLRQRAEDIGVDIREACQAGFAG